MTNLYPIYTLRIAQQLIQRGFPIVKTGLNPTKPEFKIFYFANSPQLKQALSEIMFR